MNITFEKGVYTIEHDGKAYLANLNTKTIINAKTQRTVQQIKFARNLFNTFVWKRNSELNPMLYALAYLLDYGTINSALEERNMILLEKIEKLANLGYAYNNLDLYSFARDLNPNDMALAIRCINKQEKENNYVNLANIRTDLCVEKLARNNSKVNKEFIREHIQELTNNLNVNPDTKYLDIIVYYAYTQKMILAFGTYDTSRYLRAYFEMCKLINKEPVKQSNFIREYVETKETYTRLKEIYDKEAFMRVHDKLEKKALFEYGNYTVVIPKEPKDLIMEGQLMHHCVGSYVDSVMKENTYIVFIRNKENIEAPYITCQIHPNGTIGQYFLAYDKHITSAEDIAFRNAYQRFLNANW